MHRRQCVRSFFSSDVVVAIYSRKRAQKGSFFKDAAFHEIALLFPDTSPRGAGIDGEDNDWDFGTGTLRTPFEQLAYNVAL